MIDVLFKLAVEGTKAVAQSEFGHHLIKHTVIHGGHALADTFNKLGKEDTHSIRKTSSRPSRSTDAVRPAGLPRIMKCPHCGKDVCSESQICWNCDGKIW